MKRKIVSDIVSKSVLKYSGEVNQRVNLNTQKTIVIPAKKIIIFSIISLAIFSFLLDAVNAPISTGYLFAASNIETQKAAYEAQLKELERQIAEDEKMIAQYSKQGESLKSEIAKLNAKIAKLNLQIKAITLTLDNLSKEIDKTKNQISKTESDIEKQKEYLTVILQKVYIADNVSPIEVLIANKRFSDFFLDINNLLSLQKEVGVTLEKIVELKNKLMDQKEVLAYQYGDALQLKAYQLAQQEAAKKAESEKKNLLEITKGQESKYRQLVAEKQKTAAQIRSQLFKLLGGGELQFGEAYRLAKIAQDATGVSASLILAVLDRESALGRNVGKCKYDTNPYYPTKASNPTTMHPTRDIPIFLQIVKKLNIDPNSVTVSCPIPQDGAYGGAMGPAQFIPSTWALYEERIASISGNKPPSPWNNLDAFIATALYLKDAGAGTGSLYNDKIAAAKYYAGSNWRYYVNTYGAAVIAKAQEFQKDIEILNG
jgi:membrane-bound lytic murein transglycosylase B